MQIKMFYSIKKLNFNENVRFHHDGSHNIEKKVMAWLNDRFQNQWIDRVQYHNCRVTQI